MTDSRSGKSWWRKSCLGGDQRQHGRISKGTCVLESGVRREAELIYKTGFICRLGHLWSSYLVHQDNTPSHFHPRIFTIPQNGDLHLPFHLGNVIVLSSRHDHQSTYLQSNRCFMDSGSACCLFRQSQALLSRYSNECAHRRSHSYPADSLVSMACLSSLERIPLLTATDFLLFQSVVFENGSEEKTPHCSSVGCWRYCDRR